MLDVLFDLGTCVMSREEWSIDYDLMNRGFKARLVFWHRGIPCVQGFFLTGGSVFFLFRGSVVGFIGVNHDGSLSKIGRFGGKNNRVRILIYF